MKKVVNLLLLVVAVLCTACGSGSNAEQKNPVLDFINLRFGMFIHYNMGTFHAEQWAKPGHDPKSFNPTKLDCNQWADAAKSAKMEYAVFTTKHHDGFCLWDSEVTEYDVASSSFKGDIVKEYVDAFRKKGLKIGLYFSVWDRQHKIERNSITPEGVEYTKKQLTELLTNYGEIICIVIDGWGSAWGKSPTFEELPYEVLANHIHSIQPNCLVINHSCRADLAYTQVVHYEATHGQHCPYDNTIPSQQGPTIQPAWFWEKGYEKLKLKSVESIISELNFCNSHTANYLLNAAPNVDGLMDENVVTRLREVGEVWTKPEPIEQLPLCTTPHSKVTTTASSGEQSSKNVLDANLFTHWQADKGDIAPMIEMDFGKVEKFNRVICGSKKWAKNIEAFVVEALVDDEWVEIAQGKGLGFHWGASFNEVAAQKYRVRVTKFSGPPVITEITFIKYN